MLTKLVLEARQALGTVTEQMRGIRVLLQNPWVEVRNLEEPGLPPYTYVHEPKTRGQRVAVLPFRDQDDGVRTYLLRTEPVVPWMDEPSWRGERLPCALTGSMDKPHEAPQEAALREIAEETGFVLPPDRLVPLGHCCSVKCLSTRYHLFGADTTGLLPKLAPTDGTPGEERCGVIWTRTPQRYLDPIAGMMWARLQVAG